MSNRIFNKKEICIVGAGRVGTTFAAVIAGLGLPGVNVVAVLSRSEKSLKRAADIIGGPAGNILFSSNKGDLPGSINCIMICTPDDEIKNVCSEILEVKSKAEGILFIHFSGAKSLMVFENAIDRGAFAASVHPIKSFASIEDSIRTIRGTVFGVTYSNNCTNDVKNFVDFLIKKLEGRMIIVADDTKSIYHASACVSSNYIVSLVNYAVKINEAIGISPEDSLKGLIGLIEGTVANIKKLGSRKSLTGPIARGDIGTIKEHIDSFEKHLDREQLLIYKVLGRETSTLAYENGWIDRKTLQTFYKIFSAGCLYEDNK